MVGKLAGLIQILHGGGVRLKIPLRQRQRADNAVHRRPDLMGHPGKKTGLELADFLCLIQFFLILLQTLPIFCFPQEAEQVVLSVGTADHCFPDPLSPAGLHLRRQGLRPVPAAVRRTEFPPLVRRGKIRKQTVDILL